MIFLELLIDLSLATAGSAAMAVLMVRLRRRNRWKALGLGFAQVVFGEVGVVSVEEMLKVFEDRVEALRAEGKIGAWRAMWSRWLWIVRIALVLIWDRLGVTVRRVLGGVVSVDPIDRR